jgi:hypothetical protein
VLAQDDALVQHENAKQNPEIEKENEESAELIGRFGRQRLRGVGFGSGRGARADISRILRH